VFGEPWAIASFVLHDRNALGHRAGSGTGRSLPTLVTLARTRVVD